MLVRKMCVLPSTQPPRPHHHPPRLCSLETEKSRNGINNITVKTGRRQTYKNICKTNETLQNEKRNSGKCKISFKTKFVKRNETLQKHCKTSFKLRHGMTLLLNEKQRHIRAGDGDDNDDDSRGGDADSAR